FGASHELTPPGGKSGTTESATTKRPGCAPPAAHPGRKIIPVGVFRVSRLVFVPKVCIQGENPVVSVDKTHNFAPMACFHSGSPWQRRSPPGWNPLGSIRLRRRFEDGTAARAGPPDTCGDNQVRRR